MRRVFVSFAGGLAALQLCACAGDLPDPQLVIEHRILAVRAAVVDTDRAEALPLETLQLQGLWVGPHGVTDPAQLDPRWVVCELAPGAPPLSCLGAHFPVAYDELPPCLDEAATVQAAADGPQPMVSPCTLAPVGDPQLTVPLSVGVFAGADLELTSIAGAPSGTSTAACAAALLGGEWDTPDDCMYGVQVIAPGPKPTLLQIAAEAGFDTGGATLPPASAPDTHPRISSFVVFELDAIGEPTGAGIEVLDDDVLEFPLGTILRIETSSPEEDLQSYGIVINDGTEGTVDKTETYTGLWYRTWGEQLATASLDPDSFNEWTLEPGDDDPERPDDDLAHLYYVVRDGRQGVQWRTLTVRVR